jgi:hypothetical protein
MTCAAIIWLEHPYHPAYPVACGAPASTETVVGPRCEAHPYRQPVPVEPDAARLIAGVEDCLPWCEACRGLGEYRQGPNREPRPCGYCSDLKRHP